MFGRNGLSGFLFCAWLLLPSALVEAQPAARLGISPERYIVELDEGGGVTESLMVKNLSDEPMTVKLSVGNWELDENNRVRAIPPREDSLDRWIVINPLRVTIPPNTPQTIRWAIMPRTRPVQGEYRAMIYIQEDLPERDPSADAAVRINMRMGIPVYAYVGEVAGHAAVTAVNVGDDGREVRLALANESNRHARLQGSYAIWRGDQYPGQERALELIEGSDDNAADGDVTVQKINGIVVLPGNERTVTITPELPAGGHYVMQLDASFGETVLRESVELHYGAP